jgi:hypothetical protein
MVAQANLLGALTGHPSLVGGGRERALVDLLRELVPRRYEVLTGTVLPRDASGEPSPEDRQIDAMLVDTLDYPTVLRAGEIAVALPQAVRAIIEIKSRLLGPKKEAVQEGETFLSAMRQIGELQALLGPYGPAFTALVSYGGPARNTTLRKWLKDVVEFRDAKSRQPGVDIQKLAGLSVPNMPSLIVADGGAIAMKKKSAPGSIPCYEFYRATETRSSSWCSRLFCI